MELWHPKAIRVKPASRAGGSYAAGYPWRQVLHTTEGGPGYYPSSASYFGHQNWPTGTIGRQGSQAAIFQHFPIDHSSYALQNDPGGVETNRAHVVQVEVCWWASRIGELPADIRALVRDWLVWVSHQTGAPLDYPSFSTPRRMSNAQWQNFTGVCGHRHVPENDHTDPGAIDLGAILGQPGPVPPSEDDMIDESIIPTWVKPTAPNFTFNGQPWGSRWPSFRLMCHDTVAPFEASVIAYPGAPLMAGLDKIAGWRYGDTYGIPTLFMVGLQGQPVGIDEAPGGSIIVLAADGGTFQIAKP